MKKNLVFLVLMVSSFVVTSCGDDLDVPANNKFPKKFETENTTVNFTYNGTNQLTKIQELESVANSKDYYISYGENGKPNKLTTIHTVENQSTTELQVIEYISDTQITLTSDAGLVHTITTDDKGRMLSKSSNNGTLTYSYDAQGNNVQTTATGYTFSSVFGSTYGVFRAVNTPQWLFAYFENQYHLYLVTNPTSSTIVQTVNNVSSTKYITYQYPSDFMYDGYPTRIISSTTADGVTLQSLLRITY